MKFGDKIRYVRSKMGGVSTTELGKMLNVTQSYVSRAENKNQKFGRDTLVKLSNISGLPIEFFTDDNVSTPEEVAPTPEMANELKKYWKFLKVAQVAHEAGLTEEDVLELIEVGKKLKHRE